MANESGNRQPDRSSGTRKPWPWRELEPRLQVEIEKLEIRLSELGPGYDRRRQAAFRDAHVYLAHARDALDNQSAWTWFHAARREELWLLPDSDLRLLEIDQQEEINTKLSSWRKAAVTGYPASESRVWRVVSTQKHLDETADNDNRKRLLQRRQLVIYLGSLVAALLAICLLEFVGRGLILAEGSVDGWWLVRGGSLWNARRCLLVGAEGRGRGTCRALSRTPLGAARECIPTARGRCRRAGCLCRS